MILLRVANFALLVTALLCARPAFASEPLVLDANGNVREFYGVPVTLTRSDLARLDLPTSKDEVQGGEGLTETVYAITTKEKVKVEVIFDDGGKLYRAETLSPNARGPRNIGVGSTLAEVRAAWPEGMLLFGFADGAYVTYVTGTNVLLRFDPADMLPGAFDHDRPVDFPVPDNIKVQKMSLYPKPNPVPKGQPIDPGKTWLTVTRNGEELYRLDVERAPGSPYVRLIWARRGSVELDRSVDVSKYPGFEISPMNLVRDANPIVIAFRHGNFKNCAVREDDRDLVYVTLADTGSTISPHPPESVTYKDGPGLPKYVGNMMNSAAHGCRRTYDPALGTFGLEKDDDPRQGLQ